MEVVVSPPETKLITDVEEFGEKDVLAGERVLKGFNLKVSELFVE